MKPKVYLAGPITGLSYAEARNGWRVELWRMLRDDIDCFSPMRTKDFLAGQDKLRGDPAMYDNPLATANGILTRELNDVKRCDLMIANFLGAEKVSIGTCVEFGFAYSLRKPVILVIENGPGPELKDIPKSWRPNCHAHAFLTAIASDRVDNFEDAAMIARAVLLPGV